MKTSTGRNGALPCTGMAPPLPFAVRCDAFSLCSRMTANKQDLETIMKRFGISSPVFPAVGPRGQDPGPGLSGNGAHDCFQRPSSPGAVPDDGDNDCCTGLDRK